MRDEDYDINKHQLFLLKKLHNSVAVWSIMIIVAIWVASAYIIRAEPGMDIIVMTYGLVFYVLGIMVWLKGRKIQA